MVIQELENLLNSDLYNLKLDLFELVRKHGLRHINEDTGELDVLAFSEDYETFEDFSEDVKNTIIQRVKNTENIDWDRLSLNIANNH